MKTKKSKLMFLLAAILLCITIGYAYLNSNLSINGISNITGSSWSVRWNNLNVTNGSITADTQAHILTGNTEVEYEVTLSTPGEFYEFTVDAENNGSIDAMIGSFTNKVYQSNGTTERTLPDYLTYTVTYSDGVALANNHLLAANSTETYKVRVEYKTDISANQLPSTNDTLIFRFNVTYVQADSNAVRAVPDPVSFSTDSWPTIIRAVKTNNISSYSVGDTKTIDMGSLGTHTLRISNKSTPSECSTTGFSQTACGFVLEFADIIAIHKMNPYTDGLTNGDGNKGGWEYSEMRTYLNSDIYNAFPIELKNGIINTTVVSGHGQYDSNNFTTTDKLYLLDSRELYGSGVTNGISTARDSERQLDYYSEQMVTINSYSAAQKQRLNLSYTWWLRSADSHMGRQYFNSVCSGSMCSDVSTQTNGVSPAFRIG